LGLCIVAIGSSLLNIGNLETFFYCKWLKEEDRVDQRSRMMALSPSTGVQVLVLVLCNNFKLMQTSALSRAMWPPTAFQSQGCGGAHWGDLVGVKDTECIPVVQDPPAELTGS
jgi:hypothetical protein